MALSAAQSHSQDELGYGPPGPSVARMCNHLLGGKDNFTADRSAVGEVLRHAPEMRSLAQANRDFLARAVRHLTEERGIDQFLDLGTGMPVWPNVHEIAGQGRPTARVVYVDNDPVVVAHARALLAGPGTAAVEGDVRAPCGILRDPVLTGLVDLDRPVAVLFSALLHFVRDAERPGELVRAFRDALAPGSALVISHACLDHADPEAVAHVERVYAETGTPLTVRSRAEIAGFFPCGSPEPADIVHWPRSTARPEAPAITFYGGVTRWERA